MIALFNKALIVFIFVALGVTLGIKCSELVFGSNDPRPDLPYKVVIPGVSREVEPTRLETAIRTQLPTEFPAPTELGWPMHALTGAIVWARIGEIGRATEWADEFWSLRDPTTGLWVNQMGYVDMANPFYATLLFTLLGQDSRATETSQNVVAFSRNRIDTLGVGAYNAHYVALLTAVLVGEPIDQEQLALLGPGFDGYYSPLDLEPTPKGRYYADIMRAYRNELTGTSDLLLTDKTEYCPTLVDRVVEGVPIPDGDGECIAFYYWADYFPLLPDLQGEPYSFYNDGQFFYSMEELR